MVDGRSVPRILTGVRVSPNTGTTNEEEKNKFHLVGRKLFFLGGVGGFFSLFGKSTSRPTISFSSVSG